MKLAITALLLTACATSAQPPAPTASGLVAYCNPPCPATQKCVQLVGPSPHPLPPICVPK